MGNEIASIKGLALPGFEGMQISASDLNIPSVRLMQALSPEIVEIPVEGLRVGMIIDSVTKEVLPDRFVPFCVSKSFIRFNPRDESKPNFDPKFPPKAIIWRSDDPSDERVVKECCFGPHGEAPIANTSINFLTYFPGILHPLLIRFTKTSYPAGRNVLSTAYFSQKPLWGLSYFLYSKLVKNSKGVFYVFATTTAPASADEQAIAENWHTQYSSKIKDIVSQEESDEDETMVVPF